MKQNKNYNAGVESGIKVAQKIIEKESQAMDYLQKQVDNIAEAVPDLRKAVEAVINCQSDEAISKYYGLCNRKGPNELSEHEKGILMNVIVTLAISGAAKNAEQEKFLNNLRRSMGTSNYELDSTYSYKYLADVKNIDSQIIMAKVIREYLFLTDNSFDIMDEYEELFNLFRLNEQEYTMIDGMITITFTIFGTEGVVETYGNYFKTNAALDETIPYLDIKHKDRLQISRECATIYFNNRAKREKNKYVESSSYIIYNENNQLVAYHKQDCIKKVILADGTDIKEMFDLNDVTAYQDMVFYVVGHAVFFYDLTVDVKGSFINLEKKYEDNKKVPVKNIRLSDSKFICGNDRICVIDLKTKKIDNIQVEGYGTLSTYHKYVITDNHLYFIISDTKKYCECYKIMKYGLENMQVTAASGYFISENSRDAIDIKEVGYYENNIIILLQKVNMKRGGSFLTDNGNFYCATLNTKDENAKIEVIEIMGRHNVLGAKFINQLSLYENHVVFMDHKYDVYSLDVLKGTKVLLKSKCGKNNKFLKHALCASGIGDAIENYDFYKYAGKDPSELMLMGNWLYCEMGDGPEICSIDCPIKKESKK